jgi:flagellar biosynthesis protein FliR
MPFDLLQLYQQLPAFALVAGRIGGLLMFQPLLGAMGVPVKFRVMLVLALAALMTPLVPTPDLRSAGLLEIVIGMASEVLLGGFVGVIGAIAFVAMQLAGQIIAQESGLAFGQIADPSSDEELTVLSSFYAQVGMVVYLTLGGHRALFAACMETFHTIPLLSPIRFDEGTIQLLCDALRSGENIAIRVAAPTVVTLFLVNIALGFISRTVPQLNITTLGFSMKALIGFVVMAASLPAAIQAFGDGMSVLTNWLDTFGVA